MLICALGEFSAWWVVKGDDVTWSLRAFLRCLHIPYQHSSETLSSSLVDGADIIFSPFQG